MSARRPDLKPIHLLRYGLPGAITIAGIVFFCIGGPVPAALGVTAVCIAIMIVGVNLFARMTTASQSDRDREEAARERYAQTGRWDEVAPGDPPAPVPAKEASTPSSRADGDARDRHDPGHRTPRSADSPRRRPSQARRPRRPD